MWGAAVSLAGNVRAIACAEAGDSLVARLAHDVVGFLKLRANVGEETRLVAVQGVRVVLTQVPAHLYVCIEVFVVAVIMPGEAGGGAGCGLAG